jgi:hypothetical protein
VIVNNMRANVVVLPHDDHDKAVKLLHSLDHTMWSGKVEAIQSRRSMRPSWWPSYFPSPSRSRWTVECVQRSRTRLIPIVWLLYLVQGLMLTCLQDIFLCLDLCPSQMRSSTCWARRTSCC